MPEIHLKIMGRKVLMHTSPQHPDQTASVIGYFLKEKELYLVTEGDDTGRMLIVFATDYRLVKQLEYKEE